MIKKLSISFLFLLGAYFLFSQEKEEEFPWQPLSYTIVVTASKTELPLRETTRSVIYIDQKEIKASHATTLIELLRDKAGIYISETGAGPGANSSLFVRGANSNYNIILIDGVEINMPGGDYDLGDLSLDGVDHIEIVKGAASILYGPNAASSVINIITKKDNDKEKVSTFSFMIGNYKTATEKADLNFKIKNANINLFLSRLDSDRLLKINNEYYRNIVGLRFDNSFSERESLNFVFRFTDSKDNYPTGSAGDRFLPINLYDPHQFIKNKEWLLSTNYSISSSFWQGIFKMSYTKLLLDFSDEDDGILIDPFGSYFGNDTSSRLSLEYQNNFKFDLRTVSLGIEYQRENYLSKNNYSPEAFKGDRNNIGLYLQDQWSNKNKSVFITEGIRFDKNSNYKIAISPQFSFAYFISSNIKAKSSIGLGFKAPTFWQTLGGGFAVGNPNLKPEKSLSSDFSIEYFNEENISIANTIFYNRYFDQIEYEPHFNPQIPDYQNIGESRSYGYEFSSSISFNKRFSLKSEYTFLKAEQINVPVKPEVKLDMVPEINKLLLRRPKHLASITFNYQIKKSNIRLTSLYVGKRVDLDYSKSIFTPIRVFAPSYFKINLSADYSFKPNWNLILRIENLLNKRYEEVYGFTSKGRTILFGLEYGFK